MAVRLDYGQEGHFDCEVDPEKVLASHFGPVPCPDLAGELRNALEQPFEFPPFAQLFVPADHVTLAIDRHTPQAPTLVAEVWKVLESRGVEPEDVLLLQPPGWDQTPLVDPRVELPAEIRNEVQWVIHDPTEPTNQAYLATTVRGERVYLARSLVEADVALSIGSIEFDSVLGHRGTSSVYYPGLSSTEAISRAHGMGHSELGPDDERPLRQIIDEIGWLLGTQFTIQVIPSAGAGAANVLAGATEAVFRRGTQMLSDAWLMELEHRAQTVVVAVDLDAAGHGWSQIAAALGTARNLVAKGGKIVVLSELRAELGVGMQLIRDSRSPRNALQPLRKQTPPDLIAATQLASSLDWAHVYLLSKMDQNVVDDLFMTPLANETEAQRLINSAESCVFLGSAQHTFARVESHAT